MTGPQQSTGVQVAAGMRLYMAQHGNTVAGKKIQLIVKDDATNARPGQAGGPGIDRQGQGRAAAASASRRSRSRLRRWRPKPKSRPSLWCRVPRSPWNGRPISCGPASPLAQSSATDRGLGGEEGAKRVVTLVNDWAPGLEAESGVQGPSASKRYAKSLNWCARRSPIRISHPFLQRARDHQAPITLFVFRSGRIRPAFSQQFP